jgi:hypothetical protein
MTTGPNTRSTVLPWSEARRLHGSWDTLTDGAELCGEVAVKDVEFDETRRLMVSTSVDRFATGL